MADGRYFLRQAPPDMVFYRQFPDDRVQDLTQDPQDWEHGFVFDQNLPNVNAGPSFYYGNLALSRTAGLDYTPNAPAGWPANPVYNSFNQSDSQLVPSLGYATIPQFHWPFQPPPFTGVDAVVGRDHRRLARNGGAGENTPSSKGTSPSTGDSSSGIRTPNAEGPCSQHFDLRNNRRSGRVYKKRKAQDVNAVQTPTVQAMAQAVGLRAVKKKPSCFKCFVDRNGCKPNPEDPKGRCLNCLATQKDAIPKWPCFRLKITDVSLFRDQKTPDLQWTDRWMSMDIQDITEWASNEITTVSITHGFQACLAEDMPPYDVAYKLRLRKFTPRQTDRMTEIWSDGTKMRSHYVPPFAIADMHEAGKELESYVTAAIVPALNNVVGLSEDMYWMTYRMAYRYAGEAKDPSERELLFAALRLWTVSRMTSRPEWICSEEKVGTMIDDPTCPVNGTYPVAPVLTAQLEVISFAFHLRPLSRIVLRTVQRIMKEKRRCNWFCLYLSLFILLHSASLTSRRDEEWARCLMLKSQFANPESISEHHFGMHAMLAYYHHARGGQQPFAIALDPERSHELPHLTELRPDHVEFVKQTAMWAKQKKHTVAQLRQERAYGDDFYFVSQLFDDRWTPAPGA